MSKRNITNKFLGKIGNSEFHWNTPYYLKEVDSKLCPEDKSFLTRAFGYDGVPKNCMSFWLSNSPWLSDDEQHDYVIHYHCYPDEGNECFNPEMIMPKGSTNKEKIQILVDFLEKNVISVNEPVIKRQMERVQKEIDERTKTLEDYKRILSNHEINGKKI